MCKEIFKTSGMYISLFVLMFLFVACGSGNSNSSIGATGTSNKNTVTTASSIIEPNAVTASQVTLGTLPCPVAVSDPAHWDAIIPTQPGTSAVESISCANLIGNSTIQALVKVLPNGPGNYLDIYVYNNITSPNPSKTFAITAPTIEPLALPVR